nr:PIN domain-containing protein [Spirosoma endophyticum]
MNEEWTRNLLSNRPDLTERQLQRTVRAMNEAFPDANVINYESLVQSISLPDQDDRHVVAAAVRCKADVIVTANIKDFPNEYLKQFDIEPKHPDNFIMDLIDLNPNGVLEAFKNQVSNLRRPPKTDEELLVNFREVGLETTAYELHRMLQNR